MRTVCHVVLKHRAQESTLFGISGPGETHDAIDAEDVESDGTEGSERMRAARDQCSESEPEVDSDDDDDDPDDGWLFLSDASSDEEEPPLPVPNAAGYLFTDPADMRTRFGRITEFRGQKCCRCYKHPNCSWILPRMSPVTTEAMIRWALAGLRPDVTTREGHLRMRADFAHD